MAREHPEARLEADGEVVSFVEGVRLPNYSGLVYARLSGRDYVLWLYPADAQGNKRWDIINAGSTIVQIELDKWIREKRKNVQV